jgi:hypothetical protein
LRKWRRGFGKRGNLQQFLDRRRLTRLPRRGRAGVAGKRRTEFRADFQQLLFGGGASITATVRKQRGTVNVSNSATMAGPAVRSA